MRKPSALIGFLCAGALTACATTKSVSVTGWLTSARHQWPISSAQLELSLQDTIIRGQSDSLGRFKLSAPRLHGCFRLVAKQVGYGQALANVLLKPGRVTDVGELQMQSGGIPEIGALFWKFCRMEPDTVSYYAGVTTVVDSSH
jgi:hypothetical protein